MSSDILEWRKRVFPFDSGAFVHGRYHPWVHERMELRDFDMTRLPDSPQRFVPSFYASNQDYLRMLPRAPTVPYADAYHVEALLSMLTDKMPRAPMIVGSRSSYRSTRRSLSSGRWYAR